MGRLQELTKINHHLLEHLLSILIEDGYVAVETFTAGDILTVTQSGRSLHRDHYAGRKSEVSIGDVFNLGPSATVVNRSNLIDRSSASSDGETMGDFQNVVEQLSAYIQRVGHGEAAASLQALLIEMASPPPRHGVLSTLLNDLLTAASPSPSA